jgi:hypothetical protein
MRAVRAPSSREAQTGHQPVGHISRALVSLAPIPVALLFKLFVAFDAKVIWAMRMHDVASPGSHVHVHPVI